MEMNWNDDVYVTFGPDTPFISDHEHPFKVFKKWSIIQNSQISNKVVEYCWNDVIATKAVFNALHASNLQPKRIIHSGPATIVFWEDGTKTVVKLSENDIYDEYDAFTAALAIKIFGSNSAVKKLIKNVTEYTNEK